MTTVFSTSLLPIVGMQMGSQDYHYLPPHLHLIISPVSTFNIGQVQALPVAVQDVQRATRWDILLGKVYRYVQSQSGWSEEIPDVLQPYWNRKSKMGV